jgi:hypothetical protein
MKALFVVHFKYKIYETVLEWTILLHTFNVLIEIVALRQTEPGIDKILA